MVAHLRPAAVLLILFTFITGVAYPLAVTGFAQAFLPGPANGSLVTRDGRIVGSDLIGQQFSSDRYFHGRPSATSAPDPADPTKTVDFPYNAGASSGSNLGPSSAALVEAVTARARSLGPGPQPADLVTGSASGLDPHISPAAARVQIGRVAAARGLPEQQIAALVDRHVEMREWALLGEPRVNVLRLNLALDASIRR